MKTIDMFKSFIPAFEKKIDEDYFIHLRFEIANKIQVEQIEVLVKAGKVRVLDSSAEAPEDIFVCTRETIEKLYRRELSHINAFAQEADENGDFHALIIVKEKTDDKRYYPGQEISEEKRSFMERFGIFLRFFNAHPLDEVALDLHGSRVLHGVDAIALGGSRRPLNGTIHALFSIKPNEEFKQGAIKAAIVVLDGQGSLEMDGQRYVLKAGHYYEIDPSHSPVFKSLNEERFNILYLGFT